MNTCTPYQVGNIPTRGEHCAWMESSAVVYCNSVLGARTNTEGRESCGAAMLTGRIPYWGYHLPENRYATHLVELDIEVESHRDPPIEDFDITLLGASDGFDGDVIARKVISTEAILVASPAYLARRGVPQTPADLQQHDCLRIKPDGLRSRYWRLFRSDDDNEQVELDVTPVLWANHSDTLQRAALDGAGITGATVEIAAPHLASGALVRVLNPWITGRFTLYAALPSRKFMPQRTRVFLDYLTEQTRLGVAQALSACDGCRPTGLQPVAQKAAAL